MTPKKKPAKKTKRKKKKADKKGWIEYNPGWHFNPGRGTVFGSGKGKFTAYPTYSKESKTFDTLIEAKRYIERLEQKGSMWLGYTGAK